MMMMTSISADLGPLEAPAFPLNFDPELLLNEESHADDFHQWLQSELGIFSAESDGDLQELDGLLGSTATTPVAFNNQEQESTATPGIVELFQLQVLAPGASSVQQMEQHLRQQQQQQQEHQLQQQQLQQITAPTVGHQPTGPPYASVSSTWANVVEQSGYGGMFQQQQQPQGHPMQQQPIMQESDQQYAHMLLQQQQPVGMPSPQGMQWQMQQQQHYLYLSAPAVSYMTPIRPAMYSSTPANLAYLMPSAFMPPVAALAAPNPVADQLLSSSGDLQPAAATGRSGTGDNSGRRRSHKPAEKLAAAAAGPVLTTAGPVLAPGAEKPKLPSRRFRERQKETISNLEAEVTEKLAQLQALSAENEMLKLRSAVLEATVKGREYHMEVIKEHGPPVFDAADSTHQLFTVMQQPAGAQALGSTCSHSGGSSGPAGRAHSCSSDTDGENATDTDKWAVAGETPVGLGSAHSGGMSHASAASGHGHAAAAVAAAAGCAPAKQAAATPIAAVPVKAASSGGVGAAAEASDGGCSLQCCDAPQMCSPAEQKKTIRTLKHMNVQEIIHHWKQFVHDVTGELLDAEQEGQQRRRQQAESASEAVAAASMEHSSGATTSAAASVAQVCRWCSCSEGVEHTAEACEAEQQSRDQQQGQQAASTISTVADLAFQAEVICGEDAISCTATEARITALVNKFSYMTKFVALLNPGVLYHLFGRHLDTGLPAPYSDDHWRQVVSRLGLSKHQVTVILACAELYFSSLSKLLDQRKRLQQQLKLADEGLSECQKRLLGVDGGLNQLQVLDALASNLKREHVLRIMLNCFVWGRSLNSLQFAKSAVYSYPFFPDVHAMVCVLYEDARAMAPNGQPALVFPHRQAKTAHEQQEQQQCQLQVLHEQLRAQSDGLRAEAEQQQQHLLHSPQHHHSSGSMSAGLSDIDLAAVLTA